MSKTDLTNDISSLRPKVREILRRVGYLRRAFGLIWKAARIWAVLWFGLLILQGLLPAGLVYLTKVLVDELAVAVGSGLSWENVQPVLIPAAIMGVLLVLTQVLQGITNWIRAAQTDVVTDHIKSLIHGKAAAVDLELYEIPEQSDHLSRAAGEASGRSATLLQSVGSILQSLATLMSIAVILIPYGLWLPLALLVSTLPALWVVLHHNTLHHNWWRETTEDQRWTVYFDMVLTRPVFAAEVRLFGLANYFQEAYRTLRDRLRNGKIRLLRNQNIAQITASMGAIGITVAVIAWMATRALRGTATLGDIALFYQAFNQGQSIMRSLLSSVGQLYGDSLFLEHLFSFLDQESKIKDPAEPRPVPTPLHHGIEFNDVTFCYPGSDATALRQCSLFIPAATTVAIVGPNGAGKTTVTKLLCRFYDPTNGSIKLDGVDLRDMRVRDLRRQCTVMFQHPVHFRATVEGNIRMGDLSADHHMDAIETAAAGAGATDFVEQLPKKYDTLLGKEFRGGVQLSGGQWQRISLARAFYRDAPIVILDEPTSFMDSWAETVWLDKLDRLIAGRTAVVVTHRFTTAMRADIIYVMDDGRVVEAGSHAELMAKGGLYAASWEAQTRESNAPARKTAVSLTGSD